MPPTITVTAVDHRRLGTVIEEAQRRRRLDYHLFALENELELSCTVGSTEALEDLVTMNSSVRIRNLDTGEVEIRTLVYPDEPDLWIDCISVLTQMGSALLGRRVGDEVEWSETHGKTRMRVEKVLLQPEIAAKTHN